jgi:hypothetical protein
MISQEEYNLIVGFLAETGLKGKNVPAFNKALSILQRELNKKKEVSKGGSE